MKLILLVLFLNTGTAVGLTSEYEGDEIVYRINDKLVSFFRHKNEKYLISAHCTEKSKSCIANQVLMAPFKTVLPKDALKGGKNPGAVVCRNIEHAIVIFGRDLKGHQQSFCRFSDGSLLSSGILGHLIK